MPTSPALDARRLATELGLTSWQLRLARENGILPEPDLDGRWSPDLARSCLERAPDVLAAFGDRPPIGAVKAAAQLSVRDGLDVDRADIETLAASGHLPVAGSFRGCPLYLLRDLEALNGEKVAEVVAARKGVLHDTVDVGGAARILGCSRTVFDRIAGERGLTADRLGRYPLDGVRTLAGDAELTERVRQAERAAAVARARKEEDRHERTLRDWLHQCSAYLDRTAGHPPDTTQVGRTLRSLTAARKETTHLTP